MVVSQYVEYSKCCKFYIKVFVFSFETKMTLFEENMVDHIYCFSEYNFVCTPP